MAIQFTTNGDSLANATNATVFAQSNAAQSISVWLNALWDGATKTSSMVGMYNGAGSTAAIQIGSRLAQGQCDVWTWGGAILVSTTGTVIPSNEWVNITYTFTGTTHSIYYNGVLNNTSTTAQGVIGFNQVFLNGFTTGAASETANFQLDTYTYYNRALSADEVRTIYGVRGNAHGIVNGCLLRYEFDENVVGSNVVTAINQTNYDLAVSNLVSNSARTPSVAYTADYITNNIRPPI